MHQSVKIVDISMFDCCFTFVVQPMNNFEWESFFQRVIKYCGFVHIVPNSRQRWICAIKFIKREPLAVIVVGFGLEVIDPA